LNIQEGVAFITISIDKFTESMASKYDHLDILVNNAGLFIPPHSKTEQGFGIALCVNTIGNCYITNKLLPLILKASKPRIVTVAALAINRSSHETYVKVVENNDIGGTWIFMALVRCYK
jgi:NAD(P)-dependent dehydrogenase (short-subunit alcohol dehydrogenase family)